MWLVGPERLPRVPVCYPGSCWGQAPPPTQGCLLSPASCSCVPPVLSGETPSDPRGWNSCSPEAEAAG